jgi:hypothetical protein
VEERILDVLTAEWLLEVFAFFSKIVKRGLIVTGVLVSSSDLIYHDKCLRILSLQEEKRIRAAEAQSFHRLFAVVIVVHNILLS